MNKPGDSNNKGKGFINGLFELGKKFDKLSIIAGVGITAVGSLLVAPAAVAFGAATIGGTLGMKPVGESIQDAWNKRRARSSKAGSTAIKTVSK